MAIPIGMVIFIFATPINNSNFEVAFKTPIRIECTYEYQTTLYSFVQKIMRHQHPQSLSKAIIALLFIMGAVGPVAANVILPSVFSDNMVLQQKTDAPIWGNAKAGKTVIVITSWDNNKYTTTAAADGSWSVKVKNPTAGFTPYTISISDGKTLKLNNILIGDVWICSGQSNMEMPLAGWGKVKNYEQEIADANYPAIRLLHVSKVTSDVPLDNAKLEKGGWTPCSPVSIPNFSSVAYFFGRDLLKHVNIPIGLINIAWGGTLAEAWTSKEALLTMPDFQTAIPVPSILSTAEQEKIYKAGMEEWLQKLSVADRGCKGTKAIWTAPDFADTDWKNMNLPGAWEENGLRNLDGIVWFRKTVNIPATLEGKDLKISLGEIDDNDITYFNGEQIGATNGYNLSRVYTIPAKLVKAGTAVITVKVVDNGGGGGLYGEAKSLFISGVEEQKISLAGDWKYKVGVDLKELPAPPQNNFGNPNRPTVLFNAMIHPLIPYAMRGVIWYQGEANVEKAYQYRELFPLLISDWRKQWKNVFSFYYVQLANFMKTDETPQESVWAELREAQLQTLNLANTGMAVTIDLGEAKDIHPKNKQDVGLRLALLARANTYGENVVFTGPTYSAYKIEGNKIRITFTQTANGLKTTENLPLKGFVVAGLDHQFHWADASIEGNDVIVSSPEVAFPVAVRYAWGNNPVCNLYNGAGLPASPFRTDDWPGLTFLRK